MISAASARFRIVMGSDAVALAASRGEHPFQHEEWVRAVAAARGRAHSLVAVTAARRAGGEVVLFGALHRRWGLCVFESMPMGGYGGWVGESPLAVEEECALHREWVPHAPWPLVVLYGAPARLDALPLPAVPMRWPESIRSRLVPSTFTTHVLDLSADESALLLRVRPRMRAYLRKFTSMGFDFEIEAGAAAIPQLFDWYRRGSENWQVGAGARMPMAFFEALAAVGEVWTVRLAGEVCGSALFLLGRGVVQYQASGSCRLNTPVTATEALIWAAALHYGRRGFARMNLGASEGLPSVARFKEKFGAMPVPYRRVIYWLPRLRGTAAMAASEPRP